MGTHVSKSGVRRYNMPLCGVCKKILADKRGEFCKRHMDKSYCTGKPPKTLGRKWKLNLTPEQKARRTEVGKARVMSEGARAKIRAWHVAHPNLIRQDTFIELAIQDELANRQIMFIKQFVFEGIARVDFYLPEHNVVVQCDGCYWHNCLGHYPKHNVKQRQKDITKDAKLSFRGVKVFRFWEHDIRLSAKECINRLNI